MAEELDLDIRENRLYLSPRLSPTGVQEYPALLRSAIETGNDVSLANELRNNGRMNSTEQRRKPKGGYTTAAVPITAPETLAEGEFNRFYARGLCRRSQGLSDHELRVHRAKPVDNPRPQSEALIGFYSGRWHAFGRSPNKHWCRTRAWTTPWAQFWFVRSACQDAWDSPLDE